MPVSYLLKRPAPAFPELTQNNSSTIKSMTRWPRPRKRSRNNERFKGGLSSNDWLVLESILDNGFEGQSIPPSLEAEESSQIEERIPNNLWLSLKSDFIDIIPTCRDEDLRSTLVASSPLVSPLNDEMLSTRSDDSYNHVSPTGTQQEENASASGSAIIDPETKEKNVEAELLTFPFRIISADDKFFRLTSSNVIGEPLLSVFTVQKSELFP